MMGWRRQSVERIVIAHLCCDAQSAAGATALCAARCHSRAESAPGTSADALLRACAAGATSAWTPAQADGWRQACEDSPPGRQLPPRRQLPSGKPCAPVPGLFRAGIHL